MGRRKRVQESSWAVVVVVGILLIASVWFVVHPNPEHVRAVSSDGWVRIEGVSRTSGTVLIERIDGVDVTGEGILNPIYQITLDPDGVLEETELTFLYDAFETTPYGIQEVSLYQFDQTRLTWQMLPTSFHLKTQTLTTTTTFSGSTLVGIGVRR